MRGSFLVKFLPSEILQKAGRPLPCPYLPTYLLPTYGKLKKKLPDWLRWGTIRTKVMVGGTLLPATTVLPVTWQATLKPYTHQITHLGRVDIVIRRKIIFLLGKFQREESREGKTRREGPDLPYLPRHDCRPSKKYTHTCSLGFFLARRVQDQNLSLSLSTKLKGQSSLARHWARDWREKNWIDPRRKRILQESSLARQRDRPQLRLSLRADKLPSASPNFHCERRKISLWARHWRALALILPGKKKRAHRGSYPGI